VIVNFDSRFRAGSRALVRNRLLMHRADLLDSNPQHEMSLTVEDQDTRTNVERAVELVQSWNDRKRRTFRPEHIKLAWARLRDEDWI